MGPEAGIKVSGYAIAGWVVSDLPSLADLLAHSSSPRKTKLSTCRTPQVWLKYQLTIPWLGTRDRVRFGGEGRMII
jgi:hypothetical protein